MRSLFTARIPGFSAVVRVLKLQEKWIIGVVAVQAVLFLCALFLRRNTTLQAGIFFAASELSTSLGKRMPPLQILLRIYALVKRMRVCKPTAISD